MTLFWAIKNFILGKRDKEIVNLRTKLDNILQNPNSNDISTYVLKITQALPQYTNDNNYGIESSNLESTTITTDKENISPSEGLKELKNAIQKINAQTTEELDKLSAFTKLAKVYNNTKFTDDIIDPSALYRGLVRAWNNLPHNTITDYSDLIQLIDEHDPTKTNEIMNNEIKTDVLKQLENFLYREIGLTSFDSFYKLSKKQQFSESDVRMEIKNRLNNVLSQGVKTDETINTTPPK